LELRVFWGRRRGIGGESIDGGAFMASELKF
jgi:hypothetical protein